MKEAEREGTYTNHSAKHKKITWMYTLNKSAILLVIYCAQLNDLYVPSLLILCMCTCTLPVLRGRQSINQSILEFLLPQTWSGYHWRGNRNWLSDWLVDWLIDHSLTGSVQVHIHRKRREGTYKSFSWAQKITRRMVDSFRVSLKGWQDSAP